MLSGEKIDQYRNFLNGRFLNEGIRITAGILVPVFVAAWFGQLPLGITMALGAICVSVTDSPGPLHHRINGMLWCNILVIILSVVSAYVSAYPLWLGLLLGIFGFIFSMFTVYGVRTSAVGLAALLIFILSLQTPPSGIAIWKHTSFVLIGGIWYMLFSIFLHTLRPYKMIQQVMGDYIMGISGYLDTRGGFYKPAPDYDKVYHALLQQQIHIQAQQSLLSEMLFKTRVFLRESTHTSRVLTRIYVDMAELFESVMTTFQDYKVLHKQFDDTGILTSFGEYIHTLSAELYHAGLAVKSGTASVPGKVTRDKLEQIKRQFQELRSERIDPANISEFLTLGRILNNLVHMTEKINSLHFLTSYDKKIKKPSKEMVDKSNYAETQDIRPAIFFNNLHFGSHIFRHALRVSLALVIGYGSAIIFNIGHSYWILLTIVVILKPAYSLTKKRNIDRLIGTFVGIIIGAGILYITEDNRILVALMILFMVGAYSFMRNKYFISVLFMTPYLVIFFHLLYPTSLQHLLTDRLLDTSIGSLIAFIASLFLVPSWEHEAIRGYMVRMLHADRAYFTLIGNAYTGKQEMQMQEFKTRRRDLLTSLANVSDAFNRMLSEPKRYQRNMEEIHRFVVLNHLLTSHLATLAYYLNSKGNSFRSPHLILPVNAIDEKLKLAITCMEVKICEPVTEDRDIFREMEAEIALLMHKREEEISKGEHESETRKSLINIKPVVDQFVHIYQLTGDIMRASRKLAS